MNIFKSHDQNVNDKVKKIKKILSDIVIHSKDSRKSFTLNDLHSYKREFIKLSKGVYFRYALLEENLESDVRKMTHLMQAIIEILEIMGESSLDSSARESLVNYKQFKA